MHLQGQGTEGFGGLFDKDSNGNSADIDSENDGENSDDDSKDHWLSNGPYMDS